MCLCVFMMLAAALALRVNVRWNVLRSMAAEQKSNTARAVPAQKSIIAHTPRTKQNAAPPRKTKN